LRDVDPELDRVLRDGDFMPPPQFRAASIECRTVQVPMRDGVKLSTDLYLPPKLPAPVVVVRTPYGRDQEVRSTSATMMALARRGYVVVAQDCRGTGDSEPDHWDYFVYETEDGYDCVEWITKQDWYGGFISSYGGSYTGVTQWPMAMHPRMSTAIPRNCSLGMNSAAMTVSRYMFFNVFSLITKDTPAMSLMDLERYFAKETLARGYYNEPLRPTFPEPLLRRFPQLRTLPPSEAQLWLWEQYCAMGCAQRAKLITETFGGPAVDVTTYGRMLQLFGPRISLSALTVPFATPAEPFRQLKAPPLILTGWYDWNVYETLASWQLLRREARPEIAERARIIISHYAHNMPGYLEGADEHPELLRLPLALEQVGLMTRWNEAVQQGATDRWPRVVYYLMGANEWRAASDWPVPQAAQMSFYLGGNFTLSKQTPRGASRPDQYIYDPTNPTPTTGGSINSFLYRPGGVDVSKVQRRSDVLAYTSAPLEQDLDVVGPLRMILYAASTALDTDFAVRLTDVFPDGRAIALQTGVLRARYRDVANPSLLEPGRIYRFDIDLWATANRFKAGHRLRIDVSSANFPHYDRNTNRGGEPGEPIRATQTIYHDREHPSHLIVSVLNS
jgi:hypothetical protein